MGRGYVRAPTRSARPMTLELVETREQLVDGERHVAVILAGTDEDDVRLVGVGQPDPGHRLVRLVLVILDRRRRVVPGDEVVGREVVVEFPTARDDLVRDARHALYLGVHLVGQP